MPTKNLYELSYDELRVECLRRGVQLKGDKGDFKMVEAVVALTKKLVMDGRDPIKEEFCTNEAKETKTKSSHNNLIIQEAVVALTKKLLVESLDPIKEEDENVPRKRASQTPSRTGVIVAKSDCGSSCKTLSGTIVAKEHKKPAKVLFPPTSSTISTALLSCSSPYPSGSSMFSSCPISFPVHNHVPRISSSVSVLTQFSTAAGATNPLITTPLTTTPLTTTPHTTPHHHHHPTPHVIHFHERKIKEVSFEPSKKNEKPSTKGEVTAATKKDTKTRDQTPDAWLESLHRGLDRIFFPEGCKL